MCSAVGGLTLSQFSFLQGRLGGKAQEVDAAQQQANALRAEVNEKVCLAIFMAEVRTHHTCIAIAVSLCLRWVHLKKLSGTSCLAEAGLVLLGCRVRCWMPRCPRPSCTRAAWPSSRYGCCKTHTLDFSRSFHLLDDHLLTSRIADTA